MLSWRTRHRLLQALFWNRIGSAIVERLIAYERKFNVVVRNYSLISDTNGERWILTLMDDEPVVIDVGFHDGASTNAILQARPKARVTSFDPSRFALESYKALLSADKRVSFINQALSSEPGELDFHDYDNMCNSFAVRNEMGDTKPITYKVPVSTLDIHCRDHGIDRVNFLKVDAEGFDLNVLEGARELLTNQKIDLFMFEFATGWLDSKRYLWEADKYLSALPYRLYHLFNGFLCPLVYDVSIDSCAVLPAMYVGVSERRLARGDIPLRDYKF